MNRTSPSCESAWRTGRACAGNSASTGSPGKRPSRLGPRARPAMISPMTAGCRIRWVSRAKTNATAKVVARPASMSPVMAPLEPAAIAECSKVINSLPSQVAGGTHGGRERRQELSSRSTPARGVRAVRHAPPGRRGALSPHRPAVERAPMTPTRPRQPAAGSAEGPARDGPPPPGRHGQDHPELLMPGRMPSCSRRGNAEKPQRSHTTRVSPGYDQCHSAWLSR